MPEDTVSAVPTRILVPIDFSSSSHTALEVATELADKFHAEVFLLNVVPESPVVACAAACACAAFQSIGPDFCSPSAVASATPLGGPALRAVGPGNQRATDAPICGDHRAGDGRGARAVVGQELQRLRPVRADSALGWRQPLRRSLADGNRGERHGFPRPARNRRA